MALLTSLTFAKALQTGVWTIFAYKDVIRGEWYKFTKLKTDTRLMKPSAACGTQQFQDV